MAITFYHSPGSSSLAVHIALNEVGATFEPRVMSFHKKEHHEPWFRAITPEGKVPTLVVDGQVLNEVAGCLWWVAKTYPEAGLLPVGGAFAEAQGVAWMSFIAAEIHHSRTGMEGWKACFAIADAKLEGKEWLIANHYSIADIHLFRLYWRFCGRVHPEPGTFPNMDRLYQQVMARPAVRKTFADEAAVGYELPA